MTFKEFLEKLGSIYTVTADEITQTQRSGSRYYRGPKKEDKKDNTLFIYEKWSTGGMCGGNCWDTSENTHYYSVGGEKEPSFDSLDQIITEICPTISFLHYRKLEALIEYDSWTEYEYYGNSTNYSLKKLQLSKLYQFLLDLGLV